MKSWLKKLVLVFTLIQFSTTSYAVDLSSYSLLKKNGMGGPVGNEFVSGARPGAVLMRVNLWGAVGKPGIHHVPTGTDLIELISFAGGPNTKAILDRVTIKRETSNSRKRILVDVEQILQSSSAHNIALEPNDIVVIDQTEPLFSANTMQFLTALTLVTSILFSAVLISQRSD